MSPTSHLVSLAFDIKTSAYKAAIVLVIFVAVFKFLSKWNDPNKTDFPYLGQESGNVAQKRQYFMANALKIFLNGYSKFRESVWHTISVDGDLLVIPLKYADELRKQPENVLSRNAANIRTFETKLLGITFATPLMIHVVKADLTRNMSHLNGPLFIEAQKVIHEAFGANSEFIEVKVHEKLLRVVAIVSGLAFVGPSTCHEEEYLTNSVMFTIDMFSAIAALKRWPNVGPVRRLASFFIPQMRRLKVHRERSTAYLISVIRKRRAATATTPKEKRPRDVLQWLIDKAEEFHVKEDQDIAMVLILLSVAAIHTTAMAVTQTLFDLVGYCPEVIPRVREEMQSVQAAHNGVINTEALYQMKLLDSIMRESQRLNPTNVMRMQRCVLRPFHLSDGTKIPANVDVAVPALPVNLDESKYPKADQFDPYRFVHLRSGVKDDPIGYVSREQYQFISVTKENMAFGFGQSACPGRFFAANEMKLLLFRLLMDYDIKMPLNIKGRYPNIIRGTSITPDTSKPILLRRRK